MKRMRTADLQPGMKTAEDVYSFNNQMILPKDTVLDDKMITRLEFYSVLAIRIKEETDEPASSDNGAPFVIEETSTYSQRIKSSPRFQEFEKTFINNAANFQKSMNSIVESDAPIDTEELLDSVTSMITEDMTGISVFDMLHNMRQYDDFTFMHSMNVALICNVFAGWLKLSKQDTDIVTLGALLHDIGKLKVPDNIIRKPDKLSAAEYNIIKTHTLQGYNILKSKDLNDNVKQCALMHHERCDGSGYPLNLTADHINNYAKIIAIADVYDAMTAARIYRGPLCPYRVISIFESEGLQKYDSHYLLTFLEHVVTTYMNNTVKLSNGMQGEVVFLNPTSYSRPMIKCNDTFIDLSKHPEIYIETFV